MLISEIPIYKNPKFQQCAYKVFEQSGAPSITQLSLLPGQDLSDKIYQWLVKNWANQPQATRGMVSIVADFQDGSLKSLPVQTENGRKAIQGVLKFIEEYKEALAHLIPIHFPTLSLGDTPIPEVSQVFNQMGFAERQAIIKANNEAKLELIIDDQESVTAPEIIETSQPNN